MAGWRVAAAARRGESHVRRGEAGQDALCVRFAGPGGDVLIAAVADGAGSAARGGAGAALACRAAVAAARAAVDAGLAPTAAGEAEMTAWIEVARARLAAAASARNAAARDVATTLILAVADRDGALVGHVGDGAAVARDAAGSWRALSWPDQGEHAGETRFLTDAPPAVRVARMAEPVAALALLTDGIERLVLDFAARAPHAPFFDRMIAPLARLERAGRDVGLSAALRRYLGAEAVAARTDDDRSLLLALAG